MNEHTLLFNEAQNELITIRDFIRFGTSQFTLAQLFYGHGTDDAWDDALMLVFHALHLPLHYGKEVSNCRLTASERKTILSLFERRINERMPVPYLTHEAWFAGLSFYVDERVIIPRSPFAEIIKQGFQFADINLENVEHVLDLCTGSACMAIATAKLLPGVMIDAVDINSDALSVARKNIDDYDLSHQINLIKSDLFSALAGKKYDLILCNPPYVSQEEMDLLPQEYHHEPKLALVGGTDGLDLVIKILKDAAQYLEEGGVLIMEVGFSQQALINRFPQSPFLWLEFAHGGEGIFMLTKDQLRSAQSLFK